MTLRLFWRCWSREGNMVRQQFQPVAASFWWSHHRIRLPYWLLTPLDLHTHTRHYCEFPSAVPEERNQQMTISVDHLPPLLQPHYPHQHQWPQPPFPAGTLPTLMTHGKTNKNWLRLWSDRKLQNATAWNCFGRNIGRQRGEILVGETEWNILLLKSKKYSGTGENGWEKPLWNVCCIINQLEYNHKSICEKGKQFKNFIVYWECKMKLHYWMSWCGKCIT